MLYKGVLAESGGERDSSNSPDGPPSSPHPSPSQPPAGPDGALVSPLQNFYRRNGVCTVCSFWMLNTDISNPEPRYGHAPPLHHLSRRPHLAPTAFVMPVRVRP